MHKKIIDIRTTLEKRRDYIYSQYEKIEDEICVLQSKGDRFENSLNELKTQIETCNALLNNLGVKPSDLVRKADMAVLDNVASLLTSFPKSGSVLPLSTSLPPSGQDPEVKIDRKAPEATPVVKKRNKLTFNQVLELMRGRTFTAKDILDFARKLPEPIEFSLGSVRSRISTLKGEGILEIHMIRDGELWVYKHKGCDV